MISGKLRHRIGFQSKSEVVNAAGERAVTWAFAYNMWGSVMELKGKEKFEASQLTEVADVKIKIRWRTDIDDQYRLYYTRHGSTTFFDIYSITELGWQDGLEIHAKILVGT